MNPVVVGERLRKARKRKGLILKDLADIFSVGKLSNIEKGKGPITLDDIMLICDRLEVPLDEIVDKVNEETSNEIMHKLSRIRSLITLKQFDATKRLLDVTYKEISENDLGHLLPQLRFYHGAFFLKQTYLDEAANKFNEVVNEDTFFQEEHKYKIRSYNALIHIYFLKGQMGNAWNCVIKAKEVINQSHISLIEEEGNVYFNAALISSHVGDYKTAMISIRSASELAHGSFEYDTYLVSAALQTMLNEHDTAFMNLEKCIEYFSREEDLSNLIRSMQIRYFIYHQNEEEFREVIEIDELSIIKLLDTIDQVEGNPREVFNILYLLIAMKIQKGRYEFATHLVHKVSKKQRHLEDKHRFPFRLYHLEAQIIRQTTKNKTDERKALNKALTIIGDRETLDKAIILHELYKLNASSFDEDTYIDLLRQSNDIFYSLYTNQLENIHLIQDILPKPRY